MVEAPALKGRTPYAVTLAKRPERRSSRSSTPTTPTVEHISSSCGAPENGAVEQIHSLRLRVPTMRNPEEANSLGGFAPRLMTALMGAGTARGRRRAGELHHLGLRIRQRGSGMLKSTSCSLEDIDGPDGRRLSIGGLAYAGGELWVGGIWASSSRDATGIATTPPPMRLQSSRSTPPPSTPGFLGFVVPAAAGSSPVAHLQETPANAGVSSFRSSSSPGLWVQLGSDRCRTSRRLWMHPAFHVDAGELAARKRCRRRREQRRRRWSAPPRRTSRDPNERLVDVAHERTRPVRRSQRGASRARTAFRAVIIQSG
jgi:hypothetical protein